MSGTGSVNLRVNKTGADAVFFGNTDVQQNRAWIAHVNTIDERFDIPTNNGINAIPGSGDVIFEIDYRGDLLNNVALRFVRGELNKGVSTYARPVDWEALHCIESIEWRYSNRTFFVQQGKDLYKRIKQEKTIEQRTALGKVMGGNLSQTERDARTGAQQYHVDLMCPWENLEQSIVMSALPQKIQVHVRFAPTRRWTQSDQGGVTCQFTNLNLRTHFTHYENGKAQEKFNSTRGKGLDFKVATLEYHHGVRIPAGTTKFRYQLKNFKNQIYNIRATILSVPDSEGPVANPTNFILPDRVWLEDNGTPIINIQEVKTDGLYIQNPRCWPDGAVGEPIVNIPLCKQEFVRHCRTDCFGGRTFARYNNPEIVIEFNTPTAADLIVDIDGMCHNILTQDKGDLRILLL